MQCNAIQVLVLVRGSVRRLLECLVLQALGKLESFNWLLLVFDMSALHVTVRPDYMPWNLSSILVTSLLLDAEILVSFSCNCRYFRYCSLILFEPPPRALGLGCQWQLLQILHSASERDSSPPSSLLLPATWKVTYPSVDLNPLYHTSANRTRSCKL